MLFKWKYGNPQACYCGLLSALNGQGCLKAEEELKELLEKVL